MHPNPHRSLATSFATPLFAALLGALALLVAAPAASEPWSWECFDCPGSLAPDELAHMVDSSDEESHPQHWSATYLPGEGWELAARTASPEEDGNAYAMLFLEPHGHSGFAGTGGGSVLDVSGLSLGSGAPPSGLPSPSSFRITSSGGGSSPFALLASGLGGVGVLGGGSGGRSGSPGPFAALVPDGGTPERPPGQGPTDAIPEPGAVAVFALGLLVVGAGRRLLAPRS